jgi:hypothetical protein
MSGDCAPRRTRLCLLQLPGLWGMINVLAVAIIQDRRITVCVHEILHTICLYSTKFWIWYTTWVYSTRSTAVYTYQTLVFLHSPNSCILLEIVYSTLADSTNILIFDMLMVRILANLGLCILYKCILLTQELCSHKQVLNLCAYAMLEFYSEIVCVTIQEMGMR